MPIYEYECTKCGERIEVIQKMSDKPLKKHADCGGTLHKLISAAGFQFKGTGWYVTDYAGKSASKDTGDNRPSGESKESGGKEAKEQAAKDGNSGDSKEVKEKKPVKKK